MATGAVVLSGAILASPIYGTKKAAHGIKEKYQFSRFKKTLQTTDNSQLNTVISNQFPDTAKGNRELHKRMRWLAKDAAKNGNEKANLFINALQAPRIQDVVRREDESNESNSNMSIRSNHGSKWFKSNRPKHTIEEKLNKYSRKNRFNAESSLSTLKAVKGPSREDLELQAFKNTLEKASRIKQKQQV